MDAVQAKPHFSIPSIIALIAAIASFYVGAFAGFLLAMIAIIFGLLGLVLALAPSVRGGFISLFSLFLAAIGIIAAVIKAIRWAL